MKVFNCDHCGQLLFFENVQCVSCGRTLAFVPEAGSVVSLKPVDDTLWTSKEPRLHGRRFRLCKNYREHNVCNWAVPEEQAEPLCLACGFTRVIPDLTLPGNREAWYKLETAKRRLFYSLLALKLPLESFRERENGLAFEFLADDPGLPHGGVLTGHADGTITINLAEADDAERERRRLQMHEPYRTLLGHFRHEVGHYYWDRLLTDSPRLQEFRAVFGDEQQDYGEALQRHYTEGPPADWQQRFISSYASSHPWEDWAESWSHYLLIADTLEAAGASGLAMKVPTDGHWEKPKPTHQAGSFEHLVEQWYPLAYVLNNLNRSLGLQDGYPFVLSPPAVEKLRFIHDTVMPQARKQLQPQAPATAQRPSSRSSPKAAESTKPASRPRP